MAAYFSFIKIFSLVLGSILCLTGKFKKSYGRASDIHLRSGGGFRESFSRSPRNQNQTLRYGFYSKRLTKDRRISENYFLAQKFRARAGRKCLRGSF